ncbi:MAG: hypothetical protein ACRD2W_09515 [Acidimicrobiales bacterium]
MPALTAFVEEARGLRFKQPVPVTLLSDSDLAPGGEAAEPAICTTSGGSTTSPRSSGPSA